MSRIVFIHSNNTDIGGSDLLMVQMVEQCRNSGYGCVVILSQSSEVERLYRKIDVPVKIIPMPRLSRSFNPICQLKWGVNVLVAILRLRNFISCADAALVFTNDYNELPALLAARSLKLPSIAIIRFIFPKPHWVRQLYLSLFGLCANKIVCMSRTIRDSNFHSLPFLQQKISVLHDWCKLRNEKSTDTSLTIPNIPENVALVLMPARKEPWKGQHILVEAIPEILSQVPNAYFLFIGSIVSGRGRENYEKELRERVTQLGIEAQVQFAEHEFAVDLLMKKAGVVVHCSIEPEPFGMVVLDALSCGVPVVASNAGGIHEIAGNPPAVLLHQPGNKTDLAEKIIQLLKDPLMATEMRTRGKQRAEFFSVNNRWPQYDALFQNLISNSEKVKNIALSDIDSSVELLLQKIKASDFQPDNIVYIETGARLLAHTFFKKTGIPLIPLIIRRPGSLTKSKLAFLLRFFPLFILDFFRRLEKRIFFDFSHRKIISPPVIDLAGKCILILDDASDSGKSLFLAKEWAERNGAKPGNIKAATLSVTRPETLEKVDFWLHEELCRFPWSSDSPERKKFLKKIGAL